MFLLRIILFILLKLLLIIEISPTNNLISQYKIVCDVQLKRDYMTVLPLCSSLATFNCSKDSTRIINELRTKEQMFMRVITDYNFDDWTQIFDDPHNVFIDEMTTRINEDKLTAVAFDYMYYVDGKDIYRSGKIANFLEVMKSKNPNTIFGLMIPNQPDLMQIAYDVSIVDKAADYYILKANNYRKCRPHAFHKHDIRRTTEHDINNMIEFMNAERYNISKIILLMDIIPYSFNPVKNPFNSKHYRKNMTYSGLCEVRHSSHRTTCGDTLDQFYKKGKIGRDNKFAGLYVLYVDNDDYDGCFGCIDENNDPKFPVLKVLSQAFNGKTRDQIPVLGCQSWKTK